MAGHSHWAKVKRQKEIADPKKGKLFSKLARHIITAAREGGADLETNLKLRYAVEKARAASMPKENIERCIKKGTGELEGETFESVVYEGYGPGGTAILIEALTDNRNRTVAEIRKIMEVKGGRLGGANSVAWMFEKKGLFIIDEKAVSEDELMNIVLEAGADDMERVGNSYHVTCEPAAFETVRRALAEKGIVADPAEISSIPKTNVPVDEETARKVLELLEELQDHDDVQNVYSNFEMPEKMLAEAH